MNKVIDLLKLPSLSNAYIVAGFNGVFNTVTKMDILETSFPAVERFLFPYGFFFTSFWNSKNDKDNRINLVKSMIEHNCAGIAIMPGPNLNDEIDKEIISLGDEHSFPIVYVPSSVCWSDIISQFSLLVSSINRSESDSRMVDILQSLSDFHIDKNMQRFCDQLSKSLSMPMIINVNDTYFCGLQNKAVSSILSKIHSVKPKRAGKIYNPICLHINSSNMSIVYFGNSSVIATYLDSQNITNPNLDIFYEIAPILIKELDNYNNRTDGTVKKKASLKDNTSYYLALLKKKNINSEIESLSPEYLVYEENSFYNYVILLLPQKEDDRDIVYKDYYKIIQKTNPLFFTFSRQSFSDNELYKQIGLLKYLVNSLLFLDGIFCIDELPLLYTIQYSQYEFKEKIFKINSMDLNLETEPSFFDTLRLYIVLRNINNVSDLLGIHANSVKYRIQKCFKVSKNDEFNILTELPYIRFLMSLEILKIEAIIN